MFLLEPAPINPRARAGSSVTVASIHPGRATRSTGRETMGKLLKKLLVVLLIAALFLSLAASASADGAVDSAITTRGIRRMLSGRYTGRYTPCTCHDGDYNCCGCYHCAPPPPAV